jgi:hypothetical protein
LTNKQQHKTPVMKNKESILQDAAQMTAADFVNYLNVNGIEFDVLDQDNVFDENEGLFNIIIDGFPEGESVLFIDGKYMD